MPKENTVSIFIDCLRVQVRIGITPEEREAPQSLDVSIELRVAPDYLLDVDNDNIVDYAKLYAAVKAWETRNHVDLIETYVYEILGTAFSFPAVQEACVKITKPDIFAEVEAAGLSVDLSRDRYEALAENAPSAQAIA